MAIKQLNRTLKHWSFNPDGVTATKFIQLAEQISAMSSFKATVQHQLNIQFGSIQVTGDITAVRTDMATINEQNEDPHVFNCSWTLNTNPRSTANLSINFANNTIQLNTQHLEKIANKEFKDKIQKAFPPLEPVGPQQPATSSTINNGAQENEDMSFLPGAFRPVAMPEVSDKDVFIIMSFDKGQRDAFFVSIEPTLTELGFNPIRVDQIQHNATVTPEIMRQIEKSVFIVADLTGERPNVYYEVGYAHRADKEVILVSKKDTAVHFDVAAINRIEYEDYTELSEALKKRVLGVCEKRGIDVSEGS